MQQLSDPAQPVACICHHGARSAQVVAFLERSGFESVYNLAGKANTSQGNMPVQTETSKAARRPGRKRRTAALPGATLALALALVAAAAVPHAAYAESLFELYEAAHSYDATYLSARALADSAPFRVEQSRALMRPSATLSSSGSRVETRPTIGANYSSNSIGATLSGRQPLFNRGNNATIAQAELTLESSLADLDTAEQDLMLRVSQAYFDVLGAQDTLQTTRANKAAISEQLASAKRNFEVGTATITDTREAQARFDLATAQEILAVNDLRTKRITLDQLVGQENVEPRPLATPLVLPPPLPSSINDWVGRADSEHPNIRRAQLALEVARLETEKARAGHLPTVDAVGSVGGSHQTGTISSTTASTGNNRNASVGLQLSLPLFSGYAVQNRVKETTVLQVKARNDLEGARRSAIQATRQAFLAVESGIAQVKALEAAESSTQLALDATQLGYRVGVRVNLDVLNAQTQLYTTRRDLAKARYDVVLAGLRLRQAAGRVDPDDLTAVNALLVK